MERNSSRWSRTSLYAALMAAILPVGASGQVPLSPTDPIALPGQFAFWPVASMADFIPKADGSYHGKKFNSFNQPSVNNSGLVVLRARSKGGHGSGGEESAVSLVGASDAAADNKPIRGIYARQMGSSPGPLTKVFDNSTVVPQPNNTYYNDALSTFTEFPAFPRIGAESDTIVTRAQSKPVWTWSYIDPVTGETAESRAGSSGVYARRLGESVSAMTQLGVVPPTAEHDFSHYAVPGAATTIRFDQFPGSPAVAGWNTVAFKGNYNDGVPKTGIFFRNFSTGAPNAKTRVIASSDTEIPTGKGKKFGSTAPPSASSTDVVFLGLDNEAEPTLGAIYQAALAAKPPLKVLVKIGGAVPGERGARFTRLGEGLSYDGTFVAFWGGWGGMRKVTVVCPEDGQAAVIAWCMEKSPNGDGIYQQDVPEKQGFFVHNAQTGQTYPVAKTGSVYTDFLYWTFSGRPPGVGESDADSEDFEEPRWRSAAFAAVSGSMPRAQVAFKGRKADSPTIDGIYFTVVGPSLTPVIRTVAETGPSSDGGVIDDNAAGMPITALGIERDGLRNGWLAFSASMANSLNSWAGVYVTRTVK